jgi:hypothetical protein
MLAKTEGVITNGQPQTQRFQSNITNDNGGESRCSRSVRSSRLLEDIGRCYILYLLIYYVWNIFAVISALKQRSVRLYLQLFVGGLTSCFRWLCFLAYNGVQHILTI